MGGIAQNRVPGRAHLVQAAHRFLARRLSGGGAVFHDLGNLNFTFLVNQADYDLPRQLGVIVELCRALGIPAECSGLAMSMAEQPVASIRSWRMPRSMQVLITSAEAGTTTRRV